VISYTLYVLQDEQVTRADTLEAPDDVAAIEAARARRMQADGELWCDDRLVAFVPGIPSAAPD
jgi:hypothetical protein